MQGQMKRREFVQLTLAGSALCLGGGSLTALAAGPAGPRLVSPGCRKSKVKVARLFMSDAERHHWPKPSLDLKAEVRSYQAEFEKLKDQLADVDFTVDELVTSPEQIGPLQKRLQAADGILAIHLGMGISGILDAILAADRPTMVFAAPYSGHEWTRFGALEKDERGAKLDCMLTSDRSQLAAAVRPFRAIHHLREAKILNVTSRSFEKYSEPIREKFGTEIKKVDLQRVLDACKAVDDAQAKAEAKRWMDDATKVVEPSADDVFRACKLALAFEKMLDDEQATVMTADCYGSMWQPLCQEFAYPCVGFTRLNDMGLGGICESDLQSAMTFIIYQGLSGRPGFISDPTVDESKDSIILAHCLGTRKMDGPQGPAAPFKLRTIMERQEGVVPQVQMRVGQRVTQAKLVGTDTLPYFTGEIIEAPDVDRGCRTKITVKVDGDVERLWKNWSYGLHRVTCYGDLTKDLERFCRFQGIEMINESA